MDEPKFNIDVAIRTINSTDATFVGYGTSEPPAESPTYETFKRVQFEVDPQEGKKILEFIEKKCVELLENFDNPEYVVINRVAFLHLMGYLSEHSKKLQNFTTAPKIETMCGPVTLIPVESMGTIEVVGDIHRKVYRGE